MFHVCGHKVIAVKCAANMSEHGIEAMERMIITDHFGIKNEWLSKPLIFYYSYSEYLQHQGFVIHSKIRLHLS